MSGDWSTDITLALAFIAGMVTQAVIFGVMKMRSDREAQELRRREQLDDCIYSIERKLHTLEKKVEFLMPMTEE